MGNLLSSPSTDAAYGRDKEESRDASSSASELPSFPRISDDNDNGGRRSPVAFRYNGAHPSGPESAQKDETEPMMRRRMTLWEQTPVMSTSFVLTTPTNVSDMNMSSDNPVARLTVSSPPSAHPTTLDYTLDVVTKQPTSQRNDPDVTLSLFSPTIPFEA